MNDVNDTRVGSPRNFQIMGAGFYQCAQLAFQAIIQQRIPRNHALWVGMQQNLLQAYELAAKAFLSSKGIGESELRRLAGHNISQLNQMCFAQGIAEDAASKGISELGEAMKRIESLLGDDYRTHQFRYMSGPQLTMLSDDEAVQMSLLVVDKILEISGFVWE